MPGYKEFLADQPQGKVLWIESFNIYGELVTTLIIPGQWRLGNFQVMVWLWPVDSGKAQIMDLEKRICLDDAQRRDFSWTDNSSRLNVMQSQPKEPKMNLWSLFIDEKQMLIV